MSLIERSPFSPSLATESNMDQAHYYDEPNTNTSPRESQNINEIRKLIRDQSFLANSNKTDANLIRHRSQYSESSDELEVPVRRFTPLPDIPRYDDPYYRTESRLNKNEIDGEPRFIVNTTTPAPINYDELNPRLKRALAQQESKYAYLFEADNFYNNNLKNINQMRFTRAETNKINHFAASSKKCVHRLPALEKSVNHSLPSTMDLDEDLPMNPVNENHRREIYTSPGERLVSPIKRPQAPSPAASAYRRKAKTDDGSDSEM